MRLFLVSLYAVARKELISFSRDRGLLFSTVMLQVIQMIMCGYIDTTARNVPVVVVDQDRSSYSRDLMAKIDATKTLKVTYVTSVQAEARSLIQAGRAHVAIVIPSDYHEKRSRRVDANVFVMVDGSDSTTSFQALGAVEGLMARLNLEGGSRANQPEVAPSIVLFNSQSKAAYYLLPGLLSILVLDYVFLAAYALVKERQQGTMERLVMTPLQPAALILGKLLPYGGLGFLNMALLLVLMRWVFFVPIRGDVALLLVASALYMLSILSIALFVASKAQTVGEIVTVTPLVFIIGVFVSGYVWPLSSLPKLILPVAYLHPTTHMVEVLRGISMRNAPLSELSPHFAYFVLTSTVLLTLSVRRFRASIQV